MMAELTGMDISNASMYDGATATAEAALMAFGQAKKATTVLISDTVDPKVTRVVETYAKMHRNFRKVVWQVSSCNSQTITA